MLLFKNHNLTFSCAALLISSVSLAQSPSEAVSTASKKLLAYQTKDARAAIDPVAGKADGDAAVAVALGRVLEQEKKYDEAASTLKKAASAVPSDPAPWIFLGETYLHAKKSGDADAAFGKALDLAKKAVEADSKNALARFHLGVAQQRQKRYEEAVADFGKARDLDASLAPLVLYQIGTTRAFQEKWAEAVENLTKAVEADSGIAYAYYYRGLAQDKLGKKDQLVLDLDRFVKLAPDSPEAEKAKAVLKAARR